MAAAGLDALIICGNQYAGFEGAVFYMSGFEIVHRYVYVVVPLEGEPTLVFPREARWIGDKAKPWVKDQVWPDVPGQWVRERAQEKKWKRLGVYGMNFAREVDGKKLPWNMPELYQPWGYFAVMLFMLGLAVFQIFYFKKRHWL